MLSAGSLGKKRKTHSIDVLLSFSLPLFVAMRSILPRLLSLDVVEAVGQGHRPAHLRVSSLPVRHACCSSLHCNDTATLINTHARTQRRRQQEGGHKAGAKMTYCRITDEIFMNRGATVCCIWTLLAVGRKKGLGQPVSAQKVRDGLPNDGGHKSISARECAATEPPVGPAEAAASPHRALTASAAEAECHHLPPVMCSLHTSKHTLCVCVCVETSL